MLPQIDYLDWAIRAYTYPDADDVDLGASGTRWVQPSTLGLTADAMADRTGPPRFRKAIAARYDVPEEQVGLALGTSGALYHVCGAILRPGDTVAVESPGYEPLFRVPGAHGAQVVRFERRFGEGWALEPDRVMAALGRDGRVAIVSDLHNPTGVKTDPGALRELAGMLARRDGVLIVDEAYRDFLSKDEGPVTARHYGRNVIAISSLTKVYGMAWARAGWVLAPPAIACDTETIGYYSTGSYGFGYGAAGAVGLAHANALLERSLMIAGDRVERVNQFVGKRKELAWRKPSAGVFGFPVFLNGGPAARLLDGPAKARKLVMSDGAYFGAPEGFRLAWTSDDFDRGLPLLEEALDELAAADREAEAGSGSAIPAWMRNLMKDK